MTELQVFELLKNKLDGGSQSELARKMGVSVQYLHDVLKGRRSMGPKILDHLGIVRREPVFELKRRGR